MSVTDSVSLKQHGEKLKPIENVIEKTETTLREASPDSKHDTHTTTYCISDNSTSFKYLKSAPHHL